MCTTLTQFLSSVLRISNNQPALLACRSLVLVSIILLAGCDGAQSSLDPAGRSAEKIAVLFWWMTLGAAIIWTAVVGLTIYSFYLAPGRRNRQASLLIIVGGAVVPTVVLSLLLAYGLAMMPEMLTPAPEGSLKIAVTGEQWWWRVRYESPNGEPIVLANEIRLPVGEPVEFQLESADVIHSFWIPSLGGKVDMIPGRQTRLKLEPTRTGVFRGVCAEYCGSSHALMTFFVVVSTKEDFQNWLERQREPAQSPVEPLASSGEKIFLASGCGACHTVRGTVAKGVVGPDLIYLAAWRYRFGCFEEMQWNQEGLNENNLDVLPRWVAPHVPGALGRGAKCQGTRGAGARLVRPTALASTNRHAQHSYWRRWVSRRRVRTCTDQGQFWPLADHGLVSQFYHESLRVDARIGNKSTSTG